MISKTELFIQKSNIIHNKRFDYSLVSYKNNRTKIEIICHVHGVFKQIPQSHLNGHGCERCGLENTAKLATKNTEKFINEANIAHNNKFDYTLTEYKKSNQLVKIICPIHGEFQQKAYAHLQGKGCNKCRYVKKDINTFINESNNIHKNKYDYSLVEYNGDKKKVKIICKEHGEFEQSPNRHLTGVGCPKCKESKGEKSIRLFLEFNNIEYLTQYKFNECKNVNSLPFDFYLPEHILCIEFDGKQHFEPNEYFGGQEQFEKTIENDNIKNQYCKNNNIRLIRISYKDKNEIETILSKILC